MLVKSLCDHVQHISGDVKCFMNSLFTVVSVTHALKLTPHYCLVAGNRCRSDLYTTSRTVLPSGDTTSRWHPTGVACTWCYYQHTNSHSLRHSSACFPGWDAKPKFGGPHGCSQSSGQGGSGVNEGLQSLVMWLVVLHFVVGGGSYNKIWLLNEWSSLYGWPLLWQADGCTVGHCFEDRL